MSPKKRRRSKERHPDSTTLADLIAPAPTAGDDDTGDTAPQADSSSGTGGRKISRTPVVIADPPDRKITALWVVLALLWLLGTPLALANLLFVVMDVGTAAGPVQDPAAPPLQETVDKLGNALVWVLILALAVPFAGAAAAALLRRKIAAIGFTLALAAAAVPLLWVMTPTALWDALVTHFSG